MPNEMKSKREEQVVELKHWCPCGGLHVIVLNKRQLDYLRSCAKQSHTKKLAMLSSFKYEARFFPGDGPDGQVKETPGKD